MASRGTTVAFLKSGCEHGKVINRPNFSLSPADLDNIPNLARSIANRFIKLVWTKGGRSIAGDEARSHLKPVTKSYLVLTSSFEIEFCLQFINLARSIGNMFIKLIWTKGGRSKAGDEARSHLKSVTKSYLVPSSSSEIEFCLQYFNMYRMTKSRPKLRSKNMKLHRHRRSLNSL